MRSIPVMAINTLTELFSFLRPQSVTLNILIASFILSLWHATAIAAPPVKTPAIANPTTSITFAYFPMAVPVAVLGETLKRDRVLQKELDRSGVRINFQTFAKGSDTIPLIRKKQIDAIMTADMPSIEAAITGEMLIVGTVKRSYAAVVARQGTMISQLRNKKIGNAFGSTSHYALLQALNSAGLSEKEITLVPLEVSQMPDALASGRIDAFAAWEPTPTTVLKKYPGQYAIIHRQVSNSYLSLSRRLVAEKPAAAEALAAAVVRAIRWMKKGSNLTTASTWVLTGMRDFTGRAPSLTAADIGAITHSDLLDISSAPRLTSTEKESGSILDREFDFLKSFGKIPAEASKKEFLSAIKPDLMKRVLAEPGRNKLNTFDYAP